MWTYLKYSFIIYAEENCNAFKTVLRFRLTIFLFCFNTSKNVFEIVENE